MRDSDTPTLLVGGTLDLATPAVNATRDLLGHLRNGRQVVLSELGHTTDFWTYQPAASTRLITAFLDRGRVDASRYRHRTMDFDPGARHTTIAHGIAGALVVAPLLAGLALLGVAARVRRRGRLGRPASVAVRALLAPALGLAGWLAAVLVVVVSELPLPIDRGALVLAAIAAPVAAGAYWGWADRDATRRSRRTALAAALATAVLGAWLAAGAASGLLGLLTRSSAPPPQRTWRSSPSTSRARRRARRPRQASGTAQCRWSRAERGQPWPA